jgi:hypothetical protein
MKDLVPLENPNPSELFVSGGLDPLLAAIKKEAINQVHDVSTNKGRKAIASIANKVARSKTYIDAIGKDYVAEIKAKAKVIDQERKKSRDFLDDLKAQVRAPLTEWEEQEAKRVEALHKRLAALDPQTPEFPTAAQIRAIMERLDAIEINESWDEYKEDAEQQKYASLYKLGQLRDELQSLEDAEAQAERERKERKEKEREEREERIAREAAEKARIEAERKADEERKRLEQERLEQERKAKAAAQEKEQKAREERERLARKVREAEEAAKRAEHERVLAEAQAEADKRLRKAEAERREKEAARIERERIEQQQKRKEEEEKRKAADRKHRGAIHSKVRQALVDAGIPKNYATEVVKLIASEKIEYAKITY